MPPPDGEFASPGSKRVLIVEDDESMREFLKTLVEKQGFTLQEAGTGAEALAAMRSSAPDLLLLDMMLPDRQGYEIIREMQADELREVPVIVLTARVLDKKTIDMLRQEPNVRAFLQKPPRVAELTATMHKILKTRPGA